MSSAYERAIKLIKIRSHHSEELIKKLRMRGFNMAEIEETISKLSQEKLIDNDQFAQNYLGFLIKYKTLGFYVLKSKLMQRGIASNEAENLLKQNLSLEQEKEMAKKVIEKSNQEDKIKLAQKLQRKGFRTEVIISIVK